MKKKQKKFFVYKTIISGIAAFSFLAIVWMNREAVLEDIFGPIHSQSYSKTCSPHGIPPTEWPVSLTQ